MKLKPVYLIFCILHFISIAYGCEIKDVFPKRVNPGDTVNLNIVLSLPDCGSVKYMLIMSYSCSDTIWAEEFTQLNDTTLEAKFIIPETFPLGKADLCIDFVSGRVEALKIITIGTGMTEAPDICMVTVDRMNENMIIWEDPSIGSLDSVYIYQEMLMTGNYIRIGAKSAEDATFFIDTISNPDQNSSSYKISFVDTNGYTSPLSKYHKTMHLTMSIGVGGACNLIWDDYWGFYYNSFIVYRGTSIDNLLKIAELPTNLFTYTDLAPPLGKVYYVIEVEKAAGCYLGNLKSTSDYYSSSSSNMMSLETSSLKDNLSDESISINLDEASEKLNILFKNKIDAYDISVLSIDGKEKFKQKVFGDTKLDISNFEPGIYILKIDSNRKILIKKFIIK